MCKIFCLPQSKCTFCNIVITWSQDVCKGIYLFPCTSSWTTLFYVWKIQELEGTRNSHRNSKKAREGEKGWERVREGQREPKRAGENQWGSERVREGQRWLKKVRESQEEPEEDRDGQRETGRARENQREPGRARGSERARENLREPEETREGQRDHQRESGRAREIQRGLERVREGQREPGGDGKLGRSREPSIHSLSSSMSVLSEVPDPSSLECVKFSQLVTWKYSELDIPGISSGNPLASPSSGPWLKEHLFHSFTNLAYMYPDPKKEKTFLFMLALYGRTKDSKQWIH